MEKLSIKEIIEATGGTLLWGNDDEIIESVTTDSRRDGRNMLFVPLEGDTFDGHEFIRAAFDMGAVASLTHKDTEAVCDHTLIRVADTKKALGDIARFYLNKYRVPVLAVTGSVGKTTTKDMVAAALGADYNVLKTQGNFNNDIGLPLTVFNLERENNMAVLEMGMNHFGEIAYLASIAHPDKAVITNVGMSHIENLGSREGILKAKLEITDFFDAGNTLFINGDDDMLRTVCRDSFKLVKFAIDNKDADYRAENIKKSALSIEFDAVYDGGRAHIRVELPGIHNIYNALAAFAVCKSYGMADGDIARGIASFKPSAMRMDITDTEKLTIINDCYNASPASVEAAIDVLCTAEAQRRVAILGDILEMGAFAPEAHEELGAKAVKMGVDLLITVGQNAKYMNIGAEKQGMSQADSLHFDSNKQLIAALGGLLEQGDAVLVKASRGMKLEQVADALKML